jgi:hypothetical protein
MATIFSKIVDIAFLEEPFSTKEIDDVVQDFPNNKSTGPDGLMQAS